MIRIGKKHGRQSGSTPLKYNGTDLCAMELRLQYPPEHSTNKFNVESANGKPPIVAITLC